MLQLICVYLDDPLEKSKVSSSTSIAISNKRKIIDHKGKIINIKEYLWISVQCVKFVLINIFLKDILAKQFKKNSSSKLKLEPQNENNLMVHTGKILNDKTFQCCKLINDLII